MTIRLISHLKRRLKTMTEQEDRTDVIAEATEHVYKQIGEMKRLDTPSAFASLDAAFSHAMKQYDVTAEEIAECMSAAMESAATKNPQSSAYCRAVAQMVQMLFGRGYTPID
jgi:hypothetical protein